MKYTNDVAWTMRQKYVHLNEAEYTDINHVNNRYKHTLETLLQRHALENNNCNHNNKYELSVGLLRQRFHDAIKYDSQVQKIFDK